VLWTRGGRKKEDERISAMETAVERLESSNRLLKLEWEQVFDKLNRTMGRLNARIRKDGATNAPDDEEPQTQPRTAGTGTHALLAAHRSRNVVLPR